MFPALARAAALTRHPEARSDALRGIGTRVRRAPGGMLSVTYVLEGELDRVRVPPPGPPRIADRLWQHTCCEVFIACTGLPAYHEFNFAPSGEWAAYAFGRYRERAPLGHEHDLQQLNPRIAVRRAGGTLELGAVIRLDLLSPAHAGAALSLALSAVVEDAGGSLSHWALRHPPGAPDFHHAVSFALELDEVRN